MPDEKNPDENKDWVQSPRIPRFPKKVVVEEKPKKPKKKKEKKIPQMQAAKHKSGFLGVTWDNKAKRWQAKVAFKSREVKVANSYSAKDCAAKLHKWVLEHFKAFERYLIPGYNPDTDLVDDIGVEMREEAAADPEYSYLAKRRKAREDALRAAGIEEDEDPGQDQDFEDSEEESDTLD